MVAIDLDGTIADTVGDLHAAVARMQLTLGGELASVEEVRNWVGNGIERLVHRALTQSMDEDAKTVLFDQALHLFKAAYDETNGTAAVLYPGVSEGLDWLASLSIPMVCVTNKAGRYSRPLLAALGIAPRFEHHIAGDEVPARKPDPAALLEAARRCRSNPRHCLLIGDSISDIRAARAAGFTAISVSYGYNHGLSVRKLAADQQPDAIIDSFVELPELLPGFFARTHR